MKTCFVFPGQGSQYQGMGKDLYEASKEVRDLFQLASDRCHIDTKALLFEGTDEELKATDKAQLAITLHNIAAAVYLRSVGIEADIVAGHSLGEFAALTYAGVLDYEAVFPLVQNRGLLMAKASENIDKSNGAPGMAAVIGLDPDVLASELLTANIEGLYVANFNSPKQLVLSGTAEGITKGQSFCKDLGARRYLPLKVSGPFHSPLMSEAASDFEAYIKDINFKDPNLSLYSNVTGAKIEKGSEAKDLAVKQIVSSVQWVKEEQAILNEGINRIVEVGPGSVLSGLWKAFNSDIKCHLAGTVESVMNIQE
ncbi:ACP S-malonyltransferase [Spirochaeta cellobiosiphila]|uniref:ACP S-malonyltransferase n=1 Tax=Spirochaeta cellobiosiphila TaxID=504483 RepID=UPI00040ED72C|nr:ACP S-malonyltransferase [Spirochaeta cellobiosiphila]